MGLKARVLDGRLVLDEATELPEGTVVELVIDDRDDELDSAQHAALRAAISRSLQEAADGQTTDASQVLRALRARDPE